MSFKDHSVSEHKSQYFKKALRGGEYSSQDSKVNEAIQAQPLQVRVYDNNFDKALRAFRALVQKEKVLSFYKEKQSYEKPSQRKRRKSNEGKRKALEAAAKEKRYSKHNSFLD